MPEKIVLDSNALIQILGARSRFNILWQRFIERRFTLCVSNEIMHEYEEMLNQNILVVDDVTTSGSTLNEVLRALRTLNDSNHITIFSIMGRKDLMAEA